MTQFLIAFTTGTNMQSFLFPNIVFLINIFLGLTNESIQGRIFIILKK